MKRSASGPGRPLSTRPRHGAPTELLPGQLPLKKRRIRCCTLGTAFPTLLLLTRGYEPARICVVETQDLQLRGWEDLSPGGGASQCLGASPPKRLRVAIPPGR